MGEKTTPYKRVDPRSAMLGRGNAQGTLPDAAASDNAVMALLDLYGRIRNNLDVLLAGEDQDANVLLTEMRGTYSYKSAAGADQVVKASPGFLYGMIVGADVASATIEISDHASDGDGNVKFFWTGSTLMTSLGGYVPINATMSTGITVDLTNQTNVTFIYR